MSYCKRCSPTACGLLSKFVVVALVALVVSGFLAAPASSQIQIGFCQGPPGSFLTVTIKLVICCPPLGAISTVSTTVGPIPCDDPGGVMGAVDAAMLGIMFGGGPVFAAAADVPSPVAGQARSEYTLSPGFLASGCCVIGGGISFNCGTFSLRFDSPCPKTGDPGGGGRKKKLCFDSPPPPFPTTIAVKFEDCPIIFVALDGTETADDARDKVLAALVGAGYAAFINIDGKIEVDADCMGGLPKGIDEFGVSGGLPMALGIVVCPPDLPVPVEKRTWGSVKELFR